MAENLTSAQCSIAEYEAARAAGLLVVTTADERAIHAFATALLAEKVQRIERLEAANAALLDQMHHFANADQRLWDEGMRDAESFKSWVRSRAAYLLAKFNAPPAALSQPHPHGG